MTAGTAIRATESGDLASDLDLGWLCDRYRDQAVGYAFSVLRDRALAEDAVQLAFARILARVSGGDHDLLRDDPERVVVRNTRWAALELVERRRRNETSELDQESHGGVVETASGVWERSQARMLCDQIAKSLPAHYLAVLRMRYVEERHDADGAARLRLSVKAYRCRVDRALRAARLHANRLGIDSLGGVAVVGWQYLGRRFARIRTGLVGDSTELTQVGSVGAHGLVVLLAIGGLAVAPVLLSGGGSNHTVRTPVGVSASELVSSPQQNAVTSAPQPSACNVSCATLPSLSAVPPSGSLITAPSLAPPSVSQGGVVLGAGSLGAAQAHQLFAGLPGVNVPKVVTNPPLSSLPAIPVSPLP